MQHYLYVAVSHIYIRVRRRARFFYWARRAVILFLNFNIYYELTGLFELPNGFYIGCLFGITQRRRRWSYIVYYTKITIVLVNFENCV